VIALEETCLVFKSDPITFASDEIGWYAVQVNANDIATTGAIPRWFLVTALLPEGKTTPEVVETISKQIFRACRSMEISVIGGHTEITYGLDRPLLAGTMIGEVPRENLITPQGASPGDCIFLTKGVPIEGTAILAREFADRLTDVCTTDEIHVASRFLYDPGISVLRDAQLAVQAGKVNAMHDPTEGGLSGALWELAEACGHTLVIDPQAVFIPPLSRKICEAFGINPLATIASGALLLTTPAEESGSICHTFEVGDIQISEIGFVEAGVPQVLQTTSQGRIALPRPDRDEIARIFE
jgi:hydrogenase maturation factor